MGVVKYATGIDYVSGSLSKPKKKDGHSCGTYLTGTHRVAETTSKDCTRLYIRDASVYKRSTPVGQDELLNRTRFGVIGRAVAQRMNDLSRMSTDQANYLEQRDQPGGKKTFKTYIWSLEEAAYDNAHPNG